MSSLISSGRIRIRAGINAGAGQGAPVRSWSVPVDKPLNEAGLIRIPVDSDTGGVLPTGIYLIRVTSPEQSQNDFGGTTRHLMVVSDNNVTLKAADKEGLVWATNLQSGQETPNAPITIYDPDFNKIARARPINRACIKYDVTAQRDPNINLMAVIGDYGGPFGVAVSDWNAGIAPWDFGVYANYYANAYNAYLYTDKPIYRPGQTVHIKGIVRTDDDARYAIDPNLKFIDVLIYDAQGKQVYTGTQPLNDYGTFNFDFDLDGEAALGGVFHSGADSGALSGAGSACRAVLQRHVRGGRISAAGIPGECDRGERRSAARRNRGSGSGSELLLRRRGGRRARQLVGDGQRLLLRSLHRAGLLRLE